MNDLKTFARNKKEATFQLDLITEWTKQKLEDLDIKARKILTACASFHINSDIDRF